MIVQPCKRWRNIQPCKEGGKREVQPHRDVFACLTHNSKRRGVLCNKENSCTLLAACDFVQAIWNTVGLEYYKQHVNSLLQVTYHSAALSLRSCIGGWGFSFVTSQSSCLTRTKSWAKFPIPTKTRRERRRGEGREENMHINFHSTVVPNNKIIEGNLNLCQE